MPKPKKNETEKECPPAEPALEVERRCEETPVSEVEKRFEETPVSAVEKRYEETPVSAVEKPIEAAPVSSVEKRFEEARASRRSETRRSGEPKSLVSIELDVSGSMLASGAIRAAKTGLKRLIQDILKDDLLQLTVELRVGVFAGDGKTALEFGPVDRFAEDVLSQLHDVGDGTRIGPAAIRAIEDVERHRTSLRQQGQDIRYAMAFLFTDGEDLADTELTEASRRILELERKGGFRFVAIGVEQANMKQLAKLAPEPLKLAAIDDFSNFFQWLRVVTRSLSMSQPGAKISAPDPEKSESNPTGWSKRYTEFG